MSYILSGDPRSVNNVVRMCFHLVSCGKITLTPVADEVTADTKDAETTDTKDVAETDTKKPSKRKRK